MDIGLVLLNLKQCDEHSSILKTLYDFSEQRPYDQIVVFNSYSDIVNNYMVPILHISQAKFFKGNLIVLDTTSLFLVSEFVNTNKIFYYNTVSPPWSTEKQTYSYWHKLFKNPKLNIIASTEELKDIYSITWNKPTDISERFKYETLQHIL